MAGLERSISLAYLIASQRLFDIFFDKFHLLDHLKALKDYLMLGKGDFVEILMESLGSVLSPLASRASNPSYQPLARQARQHSLPPQNLQLSVEPAIGFSNVYIALVYAIFYLWFEVRILPRGLGTEAD